MRKLLRQGGLTVGLSIVWLVCVTPHLLGQEVPPKSATGTIASARPATPSVDPRFHSPRATVRTFLIAMNQTEDDPHKIEEAVACLDLSGIPPERARAAAWR